MLLNVIDFEMPQDALDQANDGDAVYFPGIQAYQAPSGGYRITKSLQIYGDGPGNPAFGGTVFIPAGLNEDVFVIEPPAGGEIASVHLRDFKINIAVHAGNDGIKCVLAANQRVRSLRLERVNIFNLVLAAFHLEGASTLPDGIEMVAFVDSGSALCGLGAYIKHVRSLRFVRAVFNTNRDSGFWCQASGAALYLPAFDNNSDDNQGKAQANFWLFRESCGRVHDLTAVAAGYRSSPPQWK